MNSYSAIEERIDDAVDALSLQQYTNCATTARAFDVSVRTLQNR